jgi:hypothetical protein
VDSFNITDPIELPVPGKEIQMGDYLGDDFLHALIGEGYFDIDLDLSEGNVVLPRDQFTFNYTINISQDPDVSSPGSSLSNPYNGLDYPSSPPDLTSEKRFLNGQEINKKDVRIGGTVTLKPKTGGGTVYITNPDEDPLLEGQLKIKMNFTKFDEMDWDFRHISNELEAAPRSLASVAKNLNWITFDQCAVDANGESAAGIGINVNFTEIIGGLEMYIGCDALDFQDEPKLIHKGNNIFGNENDFILDLNDYKDDVKKLQFDITLFPAGPNKDVLHLENMVTGEALSIKGDAKLFQHWTEAEVNMIEALKAMNSDGVFKGTFPDTTKDKPIDLSLLNDYLEGFSFKDITAAAYLSGPDKTIKSIEAVQPSLQIEAQYSGLNNPYLIMEQSLISLARKHIVIAGNTDYLDGKGSYKKKNLPPDGNSFDFVDVLNTRPDDLVFHYNVDVPEAIIVTPEMFVDENSESVSHDIVATIMLLIRLELTAGNKGGRIKYPDMFKDQNDLLGRGDDKDDPSKPEKNSMFTSLDVGYINLAVDFSGAFFTGGKFFIEKSNDSYQPILFPQGIRVDGRRIAVNIHNKDFDIIKNNFINPDFRLEFGSGGKITIPRNIGLTSVKIEAKGKNSVKLDF